jgi:hypothetical protein
LKLLYIILIPLFCLTTDAAAQVVLSAPTKMVAPNEEFAVELRATTRDSLSSLQFSFAWNAAVVAFQRIDTVGGFPPSAISDEYGLSNSASGKFTFLWITTSNRGYRVPSDSFLIFKAIFKAVGGNGTSSALQFLSTPTTMKAGNADALAVAVTGRNGNVQVGTTAVFSADTEGVSLEQNFPNPVANQTTIPVFVKEAEDVQLEVTNLIGKIFLMQNYHFEAGRHEIRLSTAGVLPNGFFIYKLRTKRGTVSRMLIKD